VFFLAPNNIFFENDDADPVHLNIPNMPNNTSALGLSISCQNVRSFNISTKNDITQKKVIAVASLKSDIVFLSDIRLNSTKQISAKHDLEKKFFLSGYKLFHNSSLPSRGVGILIKNSLLESKFEVLDLQQTADCNALVMKVKVKGKNLLLVSIYGPNHDTEVVFFENLTNLLRNRECQIIIGGDWNATYDNSEIGTNLDVVNMRNIPSFRRTNKIREMCANLNLTEPFRTLNPYKKEYTYIPSAINDQNRSRLDYFLISHTLFNQSTRCNVPHSLTSTFFDHKPVSLYIGGKKAPNKQIIKDTILRNPDLPSHVRAAVMDCYLQHWSHGVNSDGTVTDGAVIAQHLLHIGRILKNLSDIQVIELRIAETGTNNLDELTIAAKRGEIRLLFEELPDLNFFENLAIDPSPNLFFETLVNCIKNNVLSHQAFIFKQNNIKKTTLTKRIIGLKTNFEANTVQILETERELSALTESLLKDELMHFKKFEILNDEKITPHFMNIVKAKNMDDSIENIKNENNEHFRTKEELKEYVADYYKGIYKQPQNQSMTTNVGDVDRFLGDVLHDPIVVNAKLTDDEKLSLESDITEQELTASINQANFASAPGADGVSSRFIQHFWEYFKVPLLKLCKHSFDTGTLPLFLRTANVKLIPKKGDTSKIKNWRQISLLNCFYKIISRVITLRLKKFMDKMTPICQKGYSSTRYCQEVLINVIENIEKCNRIGKKGGLISLDIKKAFDSLSHSYLEGVYDFYNFGPKLKKWIKLMCTNRKACIIIENGITTEIFDLERGNAQGDTISPYLFNLGYQILLFKLELSLQIKGILGDFADRNNEFLVRQGQGHQVSNPDPKAFAMADDCSLLVQLDRGNLQNVIDILRDFENISGLGCNLEKTVMMIIGTNEPATPEIVNIGFEIVQEITLLGAKIKRAGNIYEGNLNCILEKVRGQAHFWKRLNLSLPGRINVAKTFLYSQINYLGCFLPFTKADWRPIMLEIELYVLGNLKIAKNRLYLQKSEGGIGLIDIEDFIGSQACTWVKRAYFLNDHWKRDMFYFSGGNIFNVKQKNFDREMNPILFGIAGHFEKLLRCFTADKENFRKANVFENPCFTFDINRPHFLKKSFFTNEEWDLYEHRIKNLCFDQICGIDGVIKSKDEFEHISGINISNLKFEKIVGLARCSLLKYTRVRTLEKKTDTIQNFLMRIKKGSRRIRKIVEKKIENRVTGNISKYAELTETIIDANNSAILNNSWSYNYLDNGTRTFIFKFFNNIIGLNTRVAHFVRGHPRTCTFCDIAEEPYENDETTLHLFYDCRHVENVLTAFYTWLFELENNYYVSRLEFFVGFTSENIHRQRVLHIVNLLIKKYIWDCKQRFTVPGIVNLKLYILGELQRLSTLSRIWRDALVKSDLLNNNNRIQF